MTTPQPFTWEAYNAKARTLGPFFELFAEFSFDHLSNAEIEQIITELSQSAEALRTEASQLMRQADGDRQLSLVTEVQSND